MRATKARVVSLFCLLFLGCSAAQETPNETLIDEAAEDEAAPPSANEAPPPVPEALPSPPAPNTAYLEHCQTFYAARVAEKALAPLADPTTTCDTPIADPVAADLPLCVSGESANACAARLYESPPVLSGTCAAEDSCMRGQWLPRCVDGTDDCVEPEVMCQDGTRPLAYVEAAKGGGNSWIIELTPDGGPCQGNSCWVNYRYMRNANEAVTELAMSSMHPDYPLPKATRRGTGLVSGDAGRALSGFHRVRFDRCSDAASDAVETIVFGDGLVPGTPTKERLDVPEATRTSTTIVHHRGFNQFVALFNQLATTSGRDLDEDGTPELPSIAEADVVVLAAGSDATRWIMHAGDELAAAVNAVAPGARVVLLLDGGVEPGIDTAGRYAAGAAADYNLFKDPYVSHGLCRLPDNDDALVNEACSDTNYRPGLGDDGRPGDFDVFAARGVHLDASCVTFHAADPTPCYDKFHSLLHHTTTPVLLVSDQEDNNKLDNNPLFAASASYTWKNANAFRQTLLTQAYDVRDHWSEREENSPLPDKPRQLLRKSRRVGSNERGGNHVMFGDDDKMQWTMTRCNAAHAPAGSPRSVEEVIASWLLDTFAERFMVEDAARWDGVSEYWVTGEDCLDHE